MNLNVNNITYVIVTFKSEKIMNDYIGKTYKEVFDYYKNNNLLSLKLNLGLNFLITNKNIKKKGISIIICFAKKIIG